MKSYAQLSEQERVNMQVILQGVLDRRVEYETRMRCLANLMGETEEFTDFDEWFQSQPTNRPINQQDVEEFWDSFTPEDWS